MMTKSFSSAIYRVAGNQREAAWDRKDISTRFFLPPVVHISSFAVNQVFYDHRGVQIGERSSRPYPLTYLILKGERAGMQLRADDATST